MCSIQEVQVSVPSFNEPFFFSTFSSFLQVNVRYVPQKRPFCSLLLDISIMASFKTMVSRDSVIVQFTVRSLRKSVHMHRPCGKLGVRRTAFSVNCHRRLTSASSLANHKMLLIISAIRYKVVAVKGTLKEYCGTQKIGFRCH